MYNVYFMLLWGLRFVSVFFRLHIEKLRKLAICRWLNYVDIKNYEEDLLQEIVQNYQPEGIGGPDEFDFSHQ